MSQSITTFDLAPKSPSGSALQIRPKRPDRSAAERVEDPVAGVTEAGDDELAAVEIGIDGANEDVGGGELLADAFDAEPRGNDREQLQPLDAPLLQSGQGRSRRAAGGQHRIDNQGYIDRLRLGQL